jgi:hypothetical protein
MKKILAATLALGAGLALTPVAHADPYDMGLTVDRSPSYAGTWTTVHVTDGDGSTGTNVSVDLGDGTAPLTGVLFKQLTWHHIYQAPGTYTLTFSAQTCGGAWCVVRSVDEQILLPPTVTALVNGIPLFSNDPNVTVAGPLATAVAATNQHWGVKSGWPAPFFSTSFDMPIDLTLKATGIPDGGDVRLIYWSGFGGGSADVSLCGVGSCSSGDSGPQSATSHNTLSYTSDGPTTPWPWHLELWLDGAFLLNPQPIYSSEPKTLSDTAVFVPPACGPSAAYPCEGKISNTAKRFTYQWVQGFQGSDLFIVKHRHHVVSKTKVSGTPLVPHKHTWSCSRSGTYSLQVVGRSRNDILRKSYKWVEHCP